MKHFRARSSRSTPAIAYLEASELEPGCLGQLFRDGAAAVIIRGDPCIASLWDFVTADDAEMPWRASLYDLAANLIPHEHLTEAIGDVYFFKPGRHSYIGRKIEICLDGGRLMTMPDAFRTRQSVWRMSEQIREQCWCFSMRLMRALAPSGTGKDHRYGVRAVVQSLRYHDTVDGHQALYAMMYNSLGAWARIGYRLDRRREDMRGLWARRGVSDAMALMSIVPPLRSLVDRLNAFAGRFDKRAVVPDGYALLSKAHFDSRYFSALCGSRRNLRTDIFVDGAWLPLPMNSLDVAVFPGLRAQEAFGIRPTLHRVLQARDDIAAEGADAANVTILLGAK